MSKPLYFHGIPGSAREVTIAALTAAQFATDHDHNGHLIAFSLGTHRALHYAARHPEQVTQITLISPAAPIRSVNDLDGVAGASVFKAARHAPMLFALHQLQCLALRAAPQRFVTALFRGTCMAEQSFADHHSPQLVQVLRDSLLGHPRLYRSALRAYVRDWSDLLETVRAPVTLHHASADTWAPERMGRQLANALPDATLHTHADLGHYTTLQAALPDAVAQYPPQAKRS